MFRPRLTSSRCGAALGDCLAANAVFLYSYGLKTRDVRLSDRNWAMAQELGPDRAFPVALYRGDIRTRLTL